MSLASRPGSFGTRFQNFLYEALDLDFLYKAFTTTDITAAIGGIRALGIRGCAISMPFKEQVIPLLDSLEASARAIDSVNTVVNDGGRLTGYNTDYIAVKQLIGEARVAPATPFVLRGSGGMAKAVTAALRDLGFDSGTVVARNEVKGRALAARYGYVWRAELPAPGTPFLVNVTPLGMTGPYAGELAFPAAAIDACTIALDVVSLPAATPFVRRARAAGKPVLSGADIHVLQALEQFVLYTGKRPSAAQVKAAAGFARQVS